MSVQIIFNFLPLSASHNLVLLPCYEFMSPKVTQYFLLSMDRPIRIHTNIQRTIAFHLRADWPGF